MVGIHTRRYIYVYILSCVLNFLFSGTLLAQTTTVTGTVKNSAGEVVPGAYISVKESSRGTAADGNGNFSIKAIMGNTLEVEALGYVTQHMRITSDHLNVVLSATDTTNLNDVVITTALGVKRSTRTLGYTAQVVNDSVLTQARVTNIANGLDGKVAGLQINTVNNGVDPQTRIVLRGERSILGNNQAAIVVNGIAVSSDILSYLNPDDINSTTILKGANSAALYGSQASNGVIMIETNKGSQNGQPRISFTHTTQLESISYFPKLQRQFGSASNEFYDNYTGYFTYVPFENQQYGPEFNGQQVPLGLPVQVPGVDTPVQQYVKYSNANAIKSFFQTGITNVDGLSYANGNATSSMYLSANYMYKTGTIPKDKADRIATTFGASKQFGRFSANASMSYIRYNTDQAGGDYMQQRPVYWNVLNTPAQVNLQNYSNINTPFSDVNGYYNAYYPNPWWQIYNSRETQQNNIFFGTAELNFKAATWADITYRAGLYYTGSNYLYYRNSVSFSDYAINAFQEWGGTPAEAPGGFPAWENDSTWNNTTVQSDLFVTFHKNFFNDNFTARLIVGGTVNKQYQKYVGVTSQQLASDLYNVSNIIGVPMVNDYTYNQGAFGAYADLNLGWKNWLFVEVTGRNDWTSLLAPGNRSYFYPGVNGSFVFTDAFKGIKTALPWLTFGKLIASWTKVGNVDVQPYQLNGTYYQTNGFPYGNLAGFSMGSTTGGVMLANPDLKPEFTTSQEYGLHLVLFDNRVNAEADYYMEKTTDQTVPVTLSPATGYTSVLQNVGMVHNSGWEFSADVDIIQSRSVKWNLGANLSLNKSYVNYISDQLTSVVVGPTYAGATIETVAGQPLRTLWVTDWNRVQDGPYKGDVIVDPNTGYPEEADNPINAGRCTPADVLGITTSITWKNFTLNVVAEYRGGYVVYNEIGSAMSFVGNSAVTASAGRGKFIYPNSVIATGSGYTPNTSVAIQDGESGAGFWPYIYNSVASPFVTSGDFWKIQEVSLHYKVPLKNTKVVKELSVGIVARNLFTFLPKDNAYADPEYSISYSTATGSSATGNAQGISSEDIAPPTRLYGVTANIAF